MDVATGSPVAGTGTSGRRPAADVQRPVLRIACFIPSDREPESDYHAHLERAMTDVRRSYLRGMEHNGYGPMTFDLDRSLDGKLRIHE